MPRPTLALGSLPLPVQALASRQQGPAEGVLRPAFVGPEIREPFIDVPEIQSKPPVDPGDEIGGRYEILGSLGEGGFAQIYRARHRDLGKEFAVKIISDTGASDALIQETFANEAKMLSRLNHPNVVQVTDFGFDPQRGAFLVMEIVEGRTLREVLQEEGRLKLRRAVDLVLQISEALDYIHSCGVVHCDVKADNILLGVTGRARRRQTVTLIDFGLARTRSLGNPGGRNEYGGTPQYVAPEQIRGVAPAPSMDIYSLGVLFFELLTGQLPFQGLPIDVLRAHLKQVAPTVSSRLGAEIPRGIEDLIAKALCKDPTGRHASVGHFMYSLRTVAEMLGLQPVTKRPTGIPLALDEDDGVGGCLCQHFPYPAFVVDIAGVILRTNAPFSDLVQVEPGSLIDTNLRCTLLVSSFPTLWPPMEAALEREEPFQTRLVLDGPSAERFESLLTLTPMTGPVRGRFLGLLVPLLSGSSAVHRPDVRRATPLQVPRLDRSAAVAVEDRDCQLSLQVTRS